MHRNIKFSAGSFFLLISVLLLIASIGFLYKIHQGIVLNSRLIEVSADVEKIISADRAIWNISFDKIGENQSELNNLLLADRDTIQKFFENSGIEKEDMEFSFFVREDYRETKKMNKTMYRAGYDLVIKSKDVEKILSLRDHLSGLYKKGIVLSSNHIDFKCSTDEEIQNQLISEAAVKAYTKAKTLAKDLHIKIKRIHKIYNPNCYVEGQNRLYMMKSLAVNSADGISGGQENSQSIPKRKIKVSIRMDVELK